MPIAKIMMILITVGVALHSPSVIEPCRAEMTEERSQNSVTFSLPDVVKGAVGPFENYSDGYGNPGSTGLGYVTVLTMATGVAAADLDPKINQIVPFDLAEASDTYIGQVNLIRASSFSGLNGVIWGLDVAKSTGKKKTLFVKQRVDGSQLPVYDMTPLLDAGRSLFGTVAERRYPMLPGSHIIAAYKSYTANGPTTVWCVLAVGIVVERERDANVFMEACDEVKGKIEEQAFFDKLSRDVAESIMRVGENQKVAYKEIYVSHKSKFVPKGYVGTALAAVPYIVLARQAIPKDGPKKLLDMSVSEWEKERGLSPVRPQGQER
jgi:histidine decarboxylase